MAHTYFGFIPAVILHDSNLTTTQRLVFCEITASSNSKGYCWPSNRAMANNIGVGEQTVSHAVSALIKAGYIAVKNEGKREIYPSNTLLPPSNELPLPLQPVTRGGSNTLPTEGYKEKKLKEEDIKRAATVEKKKAPKRTKYGEYQHVQLTDSQYQRLTDDWGADELERMITNLDEGLQLKDYKYKDHNLAIRKWKKREQADTSKAKIPKDLEHLFQKEKI